MAAFLNTVAEGVWSLALIGLILLAGLYYTVRMGFPQIFRRRKCFVCCVCAAKRRAGSPRCSRSSLSSGFSPVAFLLLRAGFLLSVFFGTLMAVDMIWAMAGAMAWINVTALLLMGHLGVRIYYNYVNRQKTGMEVPVFDPLALGIRRGAEVWVEKREAAAKRKDDHG